MTEQQNPLLYYRHPDNGSIPEKNAGKKYSANRSGRDKSTSKARPDYTTMLTETREAVDSSEHV